MAIVVSQAEQERRRLFARLVERNVLPGPLKHSMIFAHANTGPLPPGRLPNDPDLPLLSKVEYRPLPDRGQ